MAGWGGAVAIMGGLVAYLWLASDSIMDELKDQRPQITIKIKPKKRVVKPASREVASAAACGIRTEEWRSPGHQQ